MTVARRDRLSGATLILSATIGIPVALFALFRLVPNVDPLLQSSSFHVAIVGGITGAALLVALATAVVARRTRAHAIVYLALGCLSLGALMLGHGLTTPGALGQPMNLWVARLPTLAIAAWTACIAATLAPADSAVARLATRRPARLLGIAGAALAVAVAIVVTRPAAGIGHHAVAHEDRVMDALALASAVVLAGLALAYLRRWRLSRDHVQYSIVVTASLSISAIVALKYGRMWRLSWWDYHAFLLVAFAVTVTAIARECRASATMSEALRPVTVRDPFEQIATRYTESLRPLVAAVEVKDAYTHGHSARVAEFATRLGVRLGLDAKSLRAVAEGAYLHDIGKIGIPDAILTKAGPLTAEEREIIEQHPIVGHEIASRAKSLTHALPVIRSHHERWDGRGYPDALGEQHIPIAARIAAVADVWDALTSDRAYRGAWPEAQAFAHMLGGRGAHFDPAVIDALESMLTERGVQPLARPAGDSTLLHEAGELCHHHALS